MSGSLTQGKKTYSAEAGVNYNVRSGKSVSAEFNPTVVVTTPQGDVLRLEGTADYRQDKMLRSDVSLTAPFLMDKPVTFKCEYRERLSYCLATSTAWASMHEEKIEIKAPYPNLLKST